MKWFLGLGIRTKLTISFAVVLVMALILTIFCVYQLRAVDKQYTNLLEGPVNRYNVTTSAVREFLNIRISVLYIGHNAGNVSLINSSKETYQQSRSNLVAMLDDYLNTVNSDLNLTLEEKQSRISAIEKATATFNSYAEVVESSLIPAAIEKSASVRMYISNAGAMSSDITAILDQIYDTEKTLTDSINESTSQQSEFLILITKIISTITLTLAIILATIVTRVIRTPIQNITKSVRDIASGNLNVNLHSNGTDEVGQLSNYIGDVIDTFNNLLSEINNVADEFEKGNINAKINVDKFNGDYQHVALAVDHTISALVDEMLLILDGLKEYGYGNFNFQMKRMPGKKAVVHETFDMVQNNLLSVSQDISKLIASASAGNLSTRVNADLYTGDWNKLVTGLNDLLATINEPVQEVSAALAQLAQANLNVKVTGVYKGEFSTMKNALNSTIINTSSYISEISDVLRKISQQNLDVTISRDYIGDFKTIKDSLNQIIVNLNTVIGDINTSAEQVAAGSQLISESSMSLAQGSTEQASAIQQLSATIVTIDQETQNNAEIAEKADLLASASKNTALRGNGEMQNMLKSMESINDAAQSIGNIIKVIDDIAFQTNLLALNAAVEAARAGEHGKGFAVVAEEVRSLAGRSTVAAKETTKLIDDSIFKATEGTVIANATAEALNEMVNQIGEISGLIASVSVSSRQQKDSIGQINHGISQIANVTQTNTSTSQEAASSSEELANQSDILKNIVGRFKLKKNIF